MGCKSSQPLSKKKIEDLEKMGETASHVFEEAFKRFLEQKKNELKKLDEKDLIEEEKKSSAPPSNDLIIEPLKPSRMTYKKIEYLENELLKKVDKKF